VFAALKKISVFRPFLNMIVNVCLMWFNGTI